VCTIAFLTAKVEIAMNRWGLLGACGALGVFLAASASGVASAEPEKAKHGRYLVELAGCGHCHTPGHFRGKEDPARELAGGDVGFEVPGAGTFIGPNLTPDKDTGLGAWTDREIVTAIRGGVRPDGRLLSPVMPWQNFSHMSDSDVHAIVAYLHTLKAVRNKVPGPFPAGGEPAVSAWRMFVPQDR
jgi:mono/diheme cytochrome c family protein